MRDSNQIKIPPEPLLTRRQWGIGAAGLAGAIFSAISFSNARTVEDALRDMKDTLGHVANKIDLISEIAGPALEDNQQEFTEAERTELEYLIKSTLKDIHVYRMLVDDYLRRETDIGVTFPINNSLEAMSWFSPDKLSRVPEDYVLNPDLPARDVRRFLSTLPDNIRVAREIEGRGSGLPTVAGLVLRIEQDLFYALKQRDPSPSVPTY